MKVLRFRLYILPLFTPDLTTIPLGNCLIDGMNVENDLLSVRNMMLNIDEISLNKLASIESYYFFLLDR